MKKYFAEFIGTFSLALTVILTSGGATPRLTPFLAALILGLMVYSLGPISGGHFNPAVTLGALSIKKIEWKDAFFYIVAQFIGAGTGLLVGRFMLKKVSKVILEYPSLFYNFFGESMKMGFAEGLGAFFLAFGVASVIYGKTPKEVSGIVVGGSLLIGIFIASTISSGVLNPAVAFALVQPFNLMYILGSITGAIAGMWTYKVVSH